MLNEWRANVWLVVELIIVILVVQFIFSSLYSIYSSYEASAGVDCDDIYVANLNTLWEGKEGYVPYDSLHSRQTDIEVLLAQLRTNPYVEVVATGSQGSLPYNYNYLGNQVSCKLDDGEEIYFQGNTRAMSPEMMEVFRLSGANGETSEQLAWILRKGDFILASAEVNYYGEGPDDVGCFLGKDVILDADSLAVFHVGAVANGMRRSDYEPRWSGVIYRLIEPDDITKVVFRVKPGMGHQFLESLKESDKHVGNVYITDFESIDRLRDACQINTTQRIRNYIICAVFLLLVIFLGFLGTFWFRTQQRVPEIAIRKVNGASNRNIYARFFAEGLIMLFAAAVITVPFTIWTITSDTFAKLGILPSGMFSNVNIQGAVLSILLLAVLIITGIYPPARKATAVDPAQALKDM